MPGESYQAGNEELLCRILENLEARISRLEKELNIEPLQLSNAAMPAAGGEKKEDAEENLEIRIGMYWFAKVGIVMLLVGVSFLLLRPFDGLSPFFAPILGGVLSAAAMALSKYLRKTSPLLSGYLHGGSFALLFLSALRLHYFAAAPVLTGTLFEAGLLVAVAAASLITSLRRNSVYLVSISLVMAYAAALLSGHLLLFGGVLLGAAGICVYIASSRGWRGLLIFGMAATYLTDLVWLLNDPVAGNTLMLRHVSSPAAFAVLFLAAFFAVGVSVRRPDGNEGVEVILASFLNALLGYGLFFLVTEAEFQSMMGLFHLIASVVFMALVAAMWIKEKSKYQTFVYAMTGYAALSVAIIANFGSPDFFILLSWQSLLVVSTAVWFRSKFIVVTNFAIYSVIFAAYLLIAGTIDITSLSFGVVALLSARVLKWKQQRLELKTEKMRTAYLAAAFVIFPYALYHALPGDYVVLSWLGVALIYYVISLVLKNSKYRWMSLLTFLMTAIYLIIVGIVRLQPVLRIVSFLVLGIVLLAISFIYARSRMKSGSKGS